MSKANSNQQHTTRGNCQEQNSTMRSTTRNYWQLWMHSANGEFTWKVPNTKYKCLQTTRISFISPPPKNSIGGKSDGQRHSLHSTFEFHMSKGQKTPGRTPSAENQSTYRTKHMSRLRYFARTETHWYSTN